MSFGFLFVVFAVINILNFIIILDLTELHLCPSLLRRRIDDASLHRRKFCLNPVSEVFGSKFASGQFVLIEMFRFSPVLSLVEQEDPGGALHFEVSASPHAVNLAIVFKKNEPLILLVCHFIEDRLKLFAIRASLLHEHDCPSYWTIVLALM